MRKCFLGVDIGSLTTKVVLIDENGRQLARNTGRTGYSGRDVAARLASSLLAELSLDPQNVAYTVATGYGRITFPAEREMSEITCQARGVYHLFAGAETVIDIGGQDSKVIRLLPGGKVADFAMNDKCAAGTGRFLEVMAGALEVDVQDLGQLAAAAKGTCAISSICTVFAESEAVSLLHKGVAIKDISLALHAAVVERTAGMLQRVGFEPPLVFTGGVANNRCIIELLETRLGVKVMVPKEPQLVGALGAALAAGANAPAC